MDQRSRKEKELKDHEHSKLLDSVAPFTSINLRMEYIKNNGSKNLEKKRNLKNKSIEVIYSNSGNKLLIR